jgi:glycosyltransferase involved in cell wall biosynthesis
MPVNKKPLVSVVISTLNTEKYLRDAINSILSQTYANFELILINDGSTDHTEDIVQSYKDFRIKYINNGENFGIPKSRNKGIRAATGKYIAVLDADDTAAKDRLKIQVKYLENKPEVAVCGSYYRAFSENRSTIIHQPLMPKQIKARLFFENPVGHSTALIRSRIFKDDNLYYDNSLKIAHDYDLWCRISHKYNIANLPFALINYRIHTSQITRTNLLLMQEDQIVLNRQAEYLLKRKLTEDEKIRHFQLMGRIADLNIPAKDNEKIKEWVNYLIKTNNKNKVFPCENFNTEMDIWLSKSQ